MEREEWMEREVMVIWNVETMITHLPARGRDTQHAVGDKEYDDRSEG